MIITLTPNPSIDRAYELDGLERGQINRALAVHIHAGGKGINVTRALTANGIASKAVYPEGPGGAELTQMLRDHGVTAAPVQVAGPTRSNITLTDSHGTTKINADGSPLSSVEQAELIESVIAHIAPGDVVLGAGSLSAATTVTFYAALAEAVSATGATFALDTSGEPLRRALAVTGIDTIKPNDEELGELVERRLRTVGDVVGAARQALAGRTINALVSLGAHGALLVTAEEVWWAGGPPLQPVSTVGAGDCTLAGFLARPEAPRSERLVEAVAWGRAAVQLPGTAAPGPADIDASVVRLVAEPAHHHRLEELT